MAKTRRALLESAIPRKVGRGLRPASETALPVRIPKATGTPDNPALPAPSFPELVFRRCSYGLTQAENLQALAIGPAAWLEQQMNPPQIDDSVLEAEIAANYPRVNRSVTELIVEARQLADGGGQAARDHLRATLLRRIKTRRQLFEVMVEFWSDHFNIDNTGAPLRIYKLVDDREVIRANALGNFKTLLRASAHSPAMLVYLENFNNVVGVAQENYARELMELHTLGVDGGYTEADVKDVARCFTGWSIRNVVADTPQFYFYPARHDTGAKVVLGNSIAAGGGVGDGDRVLDILANHPSTARHIASKLCSFFIGDDPEASVVERVAQSYLQDDGDIRAMLWTIFGSEEFLVSYDRKLRRPGALLPASLRITGASLAGDYLQPVIARLKLLGHLPYQWLAPDGYPGYFEYWINTGSSLNRWNWLLALAEGRAYSGIAVDLLGLYGAASTPTQLVDAMAPRVLRRPLGEDDRSRLIGFAADGGDTNAVLSSSNLLARAKELLGLLLSSAYFQYR